MRQPEQLDIVDMVEAATGVKHKAKAVASPLTTITEPVNLYECDCREALATLADNSLDSCVTDPPYALVSIVKRFGKQGSAPCKTYEGKSGAYERASKGFMGKVWDNGDVSHDVEFWREVYRVLKPGGFVLAFGGTRTYHRLACAIEDAGFEIRDMVQWLYGCLDADTECLTRRGWLKHDALTDDDEVMQWDSTSEEMSWTKPLEIHRHQFDGRLVAINNRNTKQLLTPNHRVYAKIRRHSRHGKPDAYEVVTAETIQQRSSAWQVDLPMAGKLLAGENVDNGFAYLVGWWLTDAWLHGDGKACMFSQSKPATLAKLRAALSIYGPSEYIKIAKEPQHNDEHSFYVTGEIAEKLRLEYPARELPWSVLSWSYAARLHLFEGLMDGDGSRRESKQHTETFWSQNQERRDVFLALCVSLGYRAFEDAANGAVYVNRKRSSTQVQDKHRSQRVPYNGIVWCVTVPTGAFVVRREGRPFITGNSGFPKSHDVSNGIDKAAGAEREVIGVREYAGGHIQNSSPDKLSPPIGTFVRAQDDRIETAPATEAAKQWEGWGTALKPSCEPICMARKPLSEKTVAANVLKWGTGAINIDGCRVDNGGGAGPVKFERVPGNVSRENYRKGTCVGPAIPTGKGRFPANVITDGSDEVVAMFPNAKSGANNVKKASGADRSGNRGSAYGQESRSAGSPMISYGDEGSVARFWYQAKATKKERVGSNHPTVKPIALMRYLTRLVTPPGGIVLDPFAGTGTTGEACHLEGFKVVMIEREADYAATICARMRKVLYGESEQSDASEKGNPGSNDGDQDAATIP